MARFELLRGDHPVGERRHGARHLVAGHEAGVEAEDIEPLDARSFQAIAERGLQLGEPEAVVEGIVRTDPGPRCAVIGDHQAVVISGVLLDRFADEVRQQRGVAGVHVAEFAQGAELAVPQPQNPRSGPVTLVTESHFGLLFAAIDQGNDVGTVVGFDLRELLEVHHHELLEVVVRHRVLKDRPAPVFGGGVLAACRWLPGYRGVVGATARTCQHHEHKPDHRCAPHVIDSSRPGGAGDSRRT